MMDKKTSVDDYNGAGKWQTEQLGWQTHPAFFRTAVKSIIFQLHLQQSLCICMEYHSRICTFDRSCSRVSFRVTASEPFGLIVPTKSSRSSQCPCWQQSISLTPSRSASSRRSWSCRWRCWMNEQKLSRSGLALRRFLTNCIVSVAVNWCENY